MLKCLKKFFSKRKEVICAYLFGSSVTQVVLKNDLDIAILVTQDALKKSDTFDLQVDFARELQSLLGRPDIDVVILNDAPLLLRHEVLKSKKIIFQRDERERIDYEVASELKFYDFEPCRRLFWKALVKKIEEARFEGV